MARKGNGSLQLAPLFSQAKALSLKAHVFISNLFTKPAHLVSHPPEKPLAKDATPPGVLEHVFCIVIRPK